MKICYECKKIFCKECLSSHNKSNPNHHTNTIEKMDIICPLHKSKYSHYCPECKKNLCDEPFSKIQYHRDFTRPLTKIIKSYKNQRDRLYQGKLRNLLGRWRKIIGDKNIKELKTNIIYKPKFKKN